MARRNYFVRAIRFCLLAGLAAVAWVVLTSTSAQADILPAPGVTGTVGNLVGVVGSTVASTSGTVASTT